MKNVRYQTGNPRPSGRGGCQEIHMVTSRQAQDAVRKATNFVGLVETTTQR